ERQAASHAGTPARLSFTTVAAVITHPLAELHEHRASSVIRAVRPGNDHFGWKFQTKSTCTPALRSASTFSAGALLSLITLCSWRTGAITERLRWPSLLESSTATVCRDTRIISALSADSSGSGVVTPTSG